MASRTVIIDDLDGSEDNVETIVFGIDGLSYEVDLGEKNHQRLRELLNPFIEAARPHAQNTAVLRRQRQVNRKSAATRQARADAPVVSAVVPAFDHKVARAWLRAHDFQVPARGKIREEVARPYLESEDFKRWLGEQG